MQWDMWPSHGSIVKTYLPATNAAQRSTAFYLIEQSYKKMVIYQPLNHEKKPRIRPARSDKTISHCSMLD